LFLWLSRRGDLIEIHRFLARNIACSRSIEPITFNPIGSSMAASVCSPTVDQLVSTVPPSGGQKRTRIRLTSKRKITTSSDQVITELYSCHSSRNRSNLVSVNLVFGRLFEAFQHISRRSEPMPRLELISNLPRRLGRHQ
jgi:hypothetical protein